MRASYQILRWGLVTLLALGAAGCASTGAPDGWLPVAEEAPLDPFGSWVTVELEKGSRQNFLAGEFLAVDGDSLYVLVRFMQPGGHVVGVSLDEVKKARIASFDPETGKAVAWVSFGSLSCLSHGLGAAVSFPLWVIMGSAMAGVHSRTPLENYPDRSWDELNMYARFPQGPPPALRELNLQPKPQGQTSSPTWSEKESVF